jgi:hypothetical protein
MLAERVIEWTKEWQQQGLAEGLVASAREGVLAALEIRFGVAPLAVQEMVNCIEDLPQLRALHRRAILAASLEEFAAGLVEGNGHHEGSR